MEGKVSEDTRRTSKSCRINGLEAFVELRDCWNWGIGSELEEKRVVIVQKVSCLELRLWRVCSY